MKIVTADITGSLILNGVDITTVSVSSSIWSGSIAGRVTNLESTASNLTTASASFSSRVSLIEGNYATTGSNTFRGNQIISGSLTTTGQIIAQTLNVQQVTSSIVFSSGSNIFGNSLSNTQQLTGSVRITGSLTVNNNPVFLQGGNSFGAQALIGTNDNQSLALETGGTIRMTIDTSGNVGIGTTSPGSLLDVDGVGTFRRGFQVTNGGTGLSFAASRLMGQMETANIFRMYVNGQDASTRGSLEIYNATSTGSPTIGITLLGTGNVGIGTTSPNRLLEVVASSGAVQGLVNNAAGGGAGIMYGRLAFYSTAFSNAYIDYGAEIRGYTEAGVDQSNLRFYTALGSTTTERMRITGGGNVLIGTTTDNGARLQVNGSASYTGTISTNRGIDAINYAFNTTSGTLRWGMGLIATETGSNAGSNFSIFRYTDAGNFNDFALILNRQTGNVRIVNTLRIDGFDSVGGQRAIGFGGNTLGTNPTIYSNGSYLVVNAANSSTLFLNADTTGNVILNGGGNLGIGTTSPTVNLQIAGTNNNAVGSSTFWNFNFVGQEITNLSNTAGTVAGLALVGGSGRNAVSAIGGILESTSLSALGFFTGGQGVGGGTVPERMRITSAGDVGVGINSPSTFGRFVVGAKGTGSKSSISVSTAGYNNVEVALIESFSSIGTAPAGIYTVNTFNSDAAHWLTFKVTNSGGTTAEAMRINSNGNVLIGTTSDSGQRLQVNGNVNANGIILGDDTTYGAPYKVVGFNSTSDGGNRILASSTTSDGMYFMAATGQGFNFRPNGGTANLVVITSSGNVGIGTTSPSTRLSIATSTTNTGINIAHSANGGIIGYANQGSTGNLFYVTTGSGTIGSGFVMDNNGNVGIGTTSPIDRLHVIGNIFSDNSSFGISQLRLKGVGTTTGFDLQNSANDGYLWNRDNGNIYFGTNNTERMRITGAGNVGIGTTSPAGRLSVTDSVYGEYLRVASGLIGGNQTSVFVAWNNAGSITLQQVVVGAADSGGTGFRLLRIPN